MPFGGSPAAVPGIVQAENFDAGGTGLGYNDRTPGNAGGAYRQTEDVDLEATADGGGGFNVGWMDPGEWLAYTVDVAAASTYQLEARVAAAAAGGTFHVESQGRPVTGTLTIPSTGGWQAWQSVMAPITLTAGRQTLRVVLDAAGPTGIVGNLNYLRISGASSAPVSATTAFGGTPAAIPGLVEAENFDEGASDAAYHDVTTGNAGGSFRTTDVDLEPTVDSGGGYNVGWMAAGEWLVYSVNVLEAGSYTLDVRVASNGAGGQFHLETDGVAITGAIPIASTGSWQTWQSIVVPGVTLNAGPQRLRLVVDSMGPGGIFGNINSLRFSRP